MARVPLNRLKPEWLATNPRRLGMGIRFDCPMAGHNHRIEVWFINPIDGDDCVTMAEGVELKSRDRLTFEDLCIYGPIEHGEAAIIVYYGQVNVVKDLPTDVPPEHR